MLILYDNKQIDLITEGAGPLKGISADQVVKEK